MLIYTVFSVNKNMIIQCETIFVLWFDVQISNVSHIGTEPGGDYLPCPKIQLGAQVWLESRAAKDTDRGPLSYCIKGKNDGK